MRKKVSHNKKILDLKRKVEKIESKIFQVEFELKNAKSKILWTSIRNIKNAYAHQLEDLQAKIKELCLDLEHNSNMYKGEHT